MNLRTRPYDHAESVAIECSTARSRFTSNALIRLQTGIGKRTALHLARMGAKVIMACRSVERGEAARINMEEEIR